jgi:hypothetical protein
MARHISCPSAKASLPGLTAAASWACVVSAAGVTFDRVITLFSLWQDDRLCEHYNTPASTQLFTSPFWSVKGDFIPIKPAAAKGTYASR